MRKAGLLLLIFWAGFSYSQNDVTENYEHIISYHSDIIVRQDCHILIQETIKVYAKGDQIQRGIFREIPLSYRYNGGNTHVGFNLIKVLRNGEEEPFHTQNMDNGIRVYVGSKDVFLDYGVHEYTLIYDIHHVLGFFEEYDEIYWNVNGNGWGFEIENISATVYYPEGADLVQYDGYTGFFGADGKEFKTKKVEGGIRFDGTRGLLPSENLTVAVAWEKGHLIYPTAWEELMFWIQSYILWIIGGAGIIIGFIYNYLMWRKYGRDPKPGTIIPLFYAPEGFSPAECAYLKKGGRPTNTLFGSTLMSLATKGLLQIDAEDGKGIFKKAKYTISKLNIKIEDPLSKLNDVEKAFYISLFNTGDVVFIEKGEYNPALKSTNMKLISSIDKKQKGKYFLRNTFLKGRQFLFPVITGVVGAIAFWNYGGAVAVLIAAVVIHIAMNVIFLRLFEQPTKEGRKRMDAILGFEMYMKYADKQRIKMTNPPSMNFEHFEENLAFAIALGVAEEWSGQFDPGIIEEGTTGHMPYYHGMAIGSFSDFSDNLTSTISSASTPPSSSGSGSGGGGFSGGGGGGGGGGGW